MRLTAEARARYALHARTRHRIASDLGTPGKALNQKLTAWWDVPFFLFRAELQKVFKRDIPLKDRDDWDDLLTTRQAEHQRRTDTIITLEQALNTRVYALFDLTPAEVRLIEERHEISVWGGLGAPLSLLEWAQRRS